MSIFRKWYWRLAAATLVGWLCAMFVVVFISLIVGAVLGRTFLVSLFYSLILVVIPMVPGVWVYHWLTREHASLIFDQETRCRECGYILRGISEPRCSECGERI